MAKETVERPGMPAFQKAVLWFFLLALAASVTARIVLAEPQAAGPNPVPADTRTLVAAEAEQHGPEPDLLRTLLPIVTEASLFGLIGFALGYTSRKVLKVFLVLVVLAFVVVQVQVARGALEVDWGGIARAVDAWFLNLQQDLPPLELLKQHVPTAVAFGIGWVVGFRGG